MHVHHAYLDIAQNIRVLFYSNHQGGSGLLIFSFNYIQVHFDSDLPELFTNSWIFPAIFAASPRAKFGRFVVLFLIYFDFFSHNKRVPYPVGKSNINKTTKAVIGIYITSIGR